MKGTTAKPDSATRMLNGVQHVYRNIQSATAQSTIRDEANKEESEYLRAVDGEDNVLQRTIEKQMNEMESSEQDPNNLEAADQEDSDDDELDVPGDPPCICDLRKEGWERIAEMNITRTKENQQKRRGRKETQQIDNVKSTRIEERMGWGIERGNDCKKGPFVATLRT